MSKTTSKKTRRRNVGRRTTSPRFILLDLPAIWRNEFAREQHVLCATRSQITEVARHADKNSLWIASRSAMIDQLIGAVAELALARSRPLTPVGNLLLLGPPRAETLAVLHGFFESVVGEAASFKILPPDQLVEVLLAAKEQARDLFIGGVVDTKSRTLALVRGDFSRLAVPLSVFRTSGTAKPDFRRFEVNDHGQTIRFGDYEASADFVLYALDSDYRTRANARRRQQERGFGPSLRRLRILRKLRRDDFEGLSAKTISRIERNEVQRPHGKTLRAICDTLVVEAEEIETY